MKAQPAPHVLRGGAPAPLTPLPAGNVWTLETALARAMEANPDLLSAKYEFERQQGFRIQVRSRLLPNITASGSVNERQQGLVDVQPSQRLHPPPPTVDTAVALYTYDARVEVRQLFFDGFGSLTQLQRQRLLASQAFQGLRTAVVRTASTIRQAFDAIQLRTVTLGTEQRRVEEFAQLVSWTRQKQSVGEVPEFELLRAEAEYEGAKADVAEAQRFLGQAEQQFRRLLQIPQSAGPLKLEGSFALRNFKMPIEKALADARKNRPDLQGLVYAAEAARKNEVSQWSSYLPRIEGYASYGLRSSYYNSSYQLRGWTVGVLGQWSIFDGDAARGRRMVAKAERRTAETKLAELEHQIASRVSELYGQLDQSRVAVEAQEKSLNLSTRASRDARRSYEVGQAGLEPVLQADITLHRAQSRYNEAIFNYNSLIADIEFAVGGELPDSVGLPETWKR